MPAARKSQSRRTRWTCGPARLYRTAGCLRNPLLPFPRPPPPPHALRQLVASHDTAEDVDQHAVDAFLGEQEPEGRGDFLCARAAADVEEVCGLGAEYFHDVHRRHREPRAIVHASDVAVEMHVAES